MATLSIHMGSPQGATYVIAPTGSDGSGTGSEANPWRTLGKLYDVLTPGDTGLCRGGTYSGTTFKAVTSQGTAGSPITVAAYSGEVPIFDGGGYGVSYNDALGFTDGACHHVLDGLQFKNFNPTQSAIIYFGGNSTAVDAHDIWLKRCRLEQLAGLSNNEHATYMSKHCHDIHVEDSLFVGKYSVDGSPGRAIHPYAEPVSHNPGAYQVHVLRTIFDDWGIAVQFWDENTVKTMTGSIIHCTFNHCSIPIDLRYHAAVTVRDNASHGTLDTDLYDPNDSASTTSDHNFWGQTLDANYYLVAGQSGRGAASDGLDAGALDW